MSFVDDSEYEIGDLKDQITDLKKTQEELINSINILHAIESQQKSGLTQVCAENEGHKIIEAQLQFVVDEARKIIQAFSNHDDYIGRKTVMQAAEDWITAHTDDHTDSDEDLEIFSILK